MAEILVTDIEIQIIINNIIFDLELNFTYEQNKNTIKIAIIILIIKSIYKQQLLKRQKIKVNYLRIKN